MGMELNDRQQQVCALACKRFGWEHQMRRVIEELRELADAIEDDLNGYKAMDDIAEERADVAIVLYQLDNILAPELLDAAKAILPGKIEKLRNYVRSGNDGR